MDTGPASTKSAKWYSDGLRYNIITTENPVANMITSNVMRFPLRDQVKMEQWVDISHVPLLVRMPSSVIFEIPSKLGVKFGRDMAER